MSYQTNLVSLKQQILERLHELITPVPIVCNTSQTLDESLTVHPTISLQIWRTEQFPVMQVWKEYDSEQEGGVLKVELYDADEDELHVYDLESIANLDELSELADYLEELTKK